MRSLRAVLLAVGVCASAVGGCAPRIPPATPVPPAPDPQPRVAAADALLRIGCFDCLADALREYDAVRSTAGAPPALVEAATLGAVRAAILLDLRERELGTTNDRYLARARDLVRGRDDLATSFAAAIDVTAAVQWRVSDVRDPADDGQFVRLLQNREAWKERVRATAGEHEFSAYIWVSFVCSTGETRSLTPDELVAPFVPLKDAPLLLYKAALCPGTRDVPARQSAIELDKLADLFKREPRFTEITQPLALHAMLLGKLEEADELLQRAYRWHANWPAVTALLASVATTAEDFERALGFYDTTLQLVPGQTQAMLGRARSLSYLGRHEDAIAAVDEILKGKQDRGEAYYWRAWNDMQLDRNDQAWADVEDAWKLYINSDVAKLAGMIAYRRQQIDVARAKFEDGHRMNPNDCEIGFYLGTVNAEQGRWPQTADAFIEAAACLEDARRGYANEIAKIQASSASPERKARQIARREKQITTAGRMLATSWFNTAVACLNLSRKDEARRYAEKVSTDEQFAARAKEILSRLEK